MENIVNKSDFYVGMERFSEADRKETEICTSQKYEDDKIIEVWYDKATGLTRTISIERTDL